MNKIKNKGNARLEAINAIGSVLDYHKTLNEHFQSGSGLTPRDGAYAKHLSYGVLRWLSALEWISLQLMDRPLKKKEKEVQRLVLIGIFQLWKDATADHAAVHATSECARHLGKHWAVGLVNAVLRRFQREKEDLLNRLAKVREAYAHPEWLLKELEKDWPEDWQDIVSANNQQAALWLRVNCQRTNRSSMMEEFQGQGFIVQKHSRATDAISIEPARPMQDLAAFMDGRVSVQDPAAQLAADLIDPKAGDRILDACAAPGGKTGHLLERQPDISLLALDRDNKRLKLIRENLDRLGLYCPLKTENASQTKKWWDGKQFDKILLDAPCSTTGVIRRHPEIKWLRDGEQVQKAVAAQRELLEALWPLLKTSGILVYATCSILKSENHEQIHGFLSRHNDARVIGPGENPDDTTAPGQQILPGEEGMDGFYYAVIHKTA